MKTRTELKYDKIIKQGLHELLKPLGFKKKASNFYLQTEELGQIINIQKSVLYSKNSIRFTINIGIFLPEYWSGLIYNEGKIIPSYPVESECIIRKRIGALRNEHDIWYEIDEESDEIYLIAKMRENLNSHILPYLSEITSKEQLIKVLDSNETIYAFLGRMIAYAELNKFDKAQNEYFSILREKTNPDYLLSVRSYGKKYCLD